MTIGYMSKVNNYYFTRRLKKIDGISFYKENLPDFIINTEINISYHDR